MSSAKHYLMYVEQNYSYAILRPLQEAIFARGGQVAWFIAGEEADASLLDEKERQLVSVEQVQEYNPCAVFVPGNVVPDFFPGVKVAIFHGFFAGKHGMSHFNIRGFFDLYCPQGPDTTAPFEKLAGELGFFRVVQTGWSKLDPLFHHSQITQKSDVIISSKRPKILFASTFSSKATAAPHVFDTIKQLSQKGEWDWLVTLHPKMDAEVVSSYKSIQGKHLKFIENSQVLQALQQADVMLCDTSSIISEFLLLQKPVVTYKTLNKGDHLIDIEAVDVIEKSIKYALTRPQVLMEKILLFSQKIHPYTDGQSSIRVLDAVDWFIDTGHKGLKNKPLNLVRKFKLRMKLSYFKF